MAAGITLMRLTLGKQEPAQELLFMAGAYTLLKQQLKDIKKSWKQTKKYPYHPASFKPVDGMDEKELPPSKYTLQELLYNVKNLDGKKYVNPETGELFVEIDDEALQQLKREYIFE